jgi:hypothetical protein
MSYSDRKLKSPAKRAKNHHGEPHHLRPIQFIAYHGTKHSGITELKEGRGAEDQRVAGVYVTRNREYAEKYTKIEGIKHPELVLTLKVILKNPAFRPDLDKIEYGISGYEVRNRLIAQGFDGVIDDTMDEIIVFDPSQIEIVR